MCFKGQGWDIPAKVPWGANQQTAFEKLKELLCAVVGNSLQIVDFSQPFQLHVDASNYAVGAILSQINDNGSDKPIAFASKKLNNTQQGWATIEKESYAVCSFMGFAEVPQLGVWE